MALTSEQAYQETMKALALATSIKEQAWERYMTSLSDGSMTETEKANIANAYHEAWGRWSGLFEAHRIIAQVF